MPNNNPSPKNLISEGVTQFQLDFIESPALEGTRLKTLNAWRSILFQLGLNGRDSDRYGGLAYGNVSQRLGSGFVISGTQTGGIPQLSTKHYSVVDSIDISSNRVRAHGPLPPSSEAMTHGAAYQAHPDIDTVLHAHAPVIWNNARALDLERTESDIGYGTPAMARAMAGFLRHKPFQVLAMGGHEDGLIATGRSPEDAAHRLLDTLIMAMILKSGDQMLR